MIVGGRDCVLGFDWSQYQPPVSHAGSSQVVAIAKSSEANRFVDPKFAAHWSTFSVFRCKATYHFARPDGADPYQDGRAEARFQLSLCPADAVAIVLDLEATAVDAFHTTEYVRGWLDEVDASGRFPRREQKVLYVGKWFTWWHSVTVAGRAVLWIPSYTAGYQANVDPTRIPLPAWSVDLWPEGWAGWQYSSSGTVDGVHPSDVSVFTTQWVNAVCDLTVPAAAPDPFPTPERTDMAKPMFETQAGGLYYLADAPEQPKGAGWWWMSSPDEVTEKAVAGIVEPARVCKIGVGDGKPAGQKMDPNAVDVYDQAWNAYPVLNGPEARS